MPHASSEVRPATTVVVIVGPRGARRPRNPVIFPQSSMRPCWSCCTGPTGRGYLAGLLERATPMHVGYPVGIEPLLNGRVYVAPPDRHLQITGHCVETTTEAREHHTRPAVDVLFRSAARDFGRRVIAIVLSGNGDDGSAGVTAVHAQAAWSSCRPRATRLRQHAALRARRHYRESHPACLIDQPRSPTRLERVDRAA